MFDIEPKSDASPAHTASHYLEIILAGLHEALAGLALLLQRWRQLWEQLVEFQADPRPVRPPRFILIDGGRP